MKKREEVIKLRNVAKYYYMGDNVVRAVDGIDIGIKKGDFVAVMGPSGSGKSTCMNLIGSLDVPTKGAIFLDGEDVSYLSESDLAELRGNKVGFIFQQFKQFLLDLAVRQTTVAIRFAIYRNCLGSSEMYIWRKYGMQPGLLDLQGVLSR